MYDEELDEELDLVDRKQRLIKLPDDLSAEDRLLIVNGNSGRVVYNDGRNDLFCVTRVVFSHYDYYGRPHYKRTMRCR